jgi:Clr5 domain
MSFDIADEESPVPNGPRALTQPGPVTKPSRRARNDQIWSSLKDDIYRIYIIDDFTLQNAKRIIEERHQFKARYLQPPLLYVRG